MINLFRKYAWFFLIMLQTFLGLGAGFLLLSSLKPDTVPAGIRMGDLSIEGSPINEIRPAISSYYDDIAKNNALIIEIDQKPFKILYSSIDASVDLDKTMENIERSTPQNELERFFHDPNKDSVLEPIFSYNSGKLILMCEQLFALYEKKPIAEHYQVNKDVLTYNPPVPGIKVDYAALEQELQKKLFQLAEEIVVVDTQKSSFFMKEPYKGNYAEPFTALVSKAVILLESDLTNKAHNIITPLHGVVFEKGQEINLKSLLDFSQFSSEIEKDLLNRISTTLYQAAISIDGIQIIHRKPSKHAVAYTDTGLEAVIEGEGANLVLKNGTNLPLMLLTDVADGSITFFIASTGEIKSGILIVQKEKEVPPPVITSVNKDLAPHETKVVSKGIPGFTSIVSRVIDDDRVELYRDQYQPVSKIIESGQKPMRTSDK